MARDQTRRNLASPDQRVDTEEVQAAEAGRNFSGVLNPVESVVPSSVHQTVVTVWDTTPD